MEHPCSMVDPHQEYVTWKFPEFLPTDPFFLVYHPCMCGHEIRVEAVTIQSYIERGLQAVQQEQRNNYANQALANHLAENYQYPPANQNYGNNYIDANGNEEHIVEYEHDYDQRPNWPPELQERQPNLLAPVLQNRLVYPEYDGDESYENEDERNLSAMESEYQSSEVSNSGDESDEAER